MATQSAAVLAVCVCVCAEYYQHYSVAHTSDNPALSSHLLTLYATH